LIKLNEQTNVLVTGGAGFIGSLLCERLVELGANVVCFDNLSSGKMDYISTMLDRQNFGFVRGDVTNPADLERVPRDVHVIFHLAAKVGVRRYVEDPIGVIRTNIYGTDNLLQFALKVGAKRFVLASTSEVYGKNLNVSLKEESDRVLGATTIDRWCYASSKAIDEHICNAYFRRDGLPVTILRYFNVYGPRQETSDYGGVVSIFISRVLQDKPPPIHGNGKQTRSFTYVADAIEGTLIAATEDRAVGETFNLGTPIETTINKLAELIVGLAGKSGKLRPQYVPYEEFYGVWYEDVPRRIPDISKAREILGFKPKYGLHEGLRKTISWYKQHLSLHTNAAESRPGTIRHDR